ncbi:hypothetical protein Poly24_01700 [Rosistilla carotiformis]|uniref:Uncharacterized protein n=1 Tax=Rosistilla carotiformis TaxID=2528017 RepID=A0A518JLS8_9BACT|nr:hypothetical protein [Rosistilla carotiformis]QDV66484.1 hypothetical protein Poly24_01700 [Rosistilla carotiformis]
MTKPNPARPNLTTLLAVLALAGAAVYFVPIARSQTPSDNAPANASNAPAESAGSSSNATKAWQTLNGAIRQLVDTGPAFEAKLRQVTRVDGQEVRAVGRYIQSSGLRGLMRMELQSPIGDQTSRFEQTCDGRLTWTREQVGDQVRIRRVDVGRLDELAFTSGISARFKVGGLPELLDSIAWDYDLHLVRGVLKETQNVWIVRGTLKASRMQTLLDENGQAVAPPELPTKVRVALAADGPFRLIPVRMEFSSEPSSGDSGPARLISELDIYEIKAIDPPKEELFRYSTTEDDAHFTNETQIYLDRFQTRMATIPATPSLRR